MSAYTLLRFIDREDSVEMELVRSDGSAVRVAELGEEYNSAARSAVAEFATALAQHLGLKVETVYL